MFLSAKIECLITIYFKNKEENTQFVDIDKMAQPIYIRVNEKMYRKKLYKVLNCTRHFTHVRITRQKN